MEVMYTTTRREQFRSKTSSLRKFFYNSTFKSEKISADDIPRIDPINYLHASGYKLVLQLLFSRFLVGTSFDKFNPFTLVFTFKCKVFKLTTISRLNFTLLVTTICIKTLVFTSL